MYVMYDYVWIAVGMGLFGTGLVVHVTKRFFPTCCRSGEARPEKPSGSWSPRLSNQELRLS
jgi:hypothetical protein